MPRKLSINNSLLACFAWLRIAMFHANCARVTLSMNVAKQVLIVHLSGGRFIMTRVISALEVANLVPYPINIGKARN